MREKEMDSLKVYGERENERVLRIIRKVITRSWRRERKDMEKGTKNV